jgi:hypothetical protein
MILSPSDSQLFYQLMWPLQFYVNEQKGIHKNVTTLKGYEALSMAQKFEVRKVLWEHPDLIDAFVSKNPANFSEGELNIVRQWRALFVQGNFYIFRHLKKGSIFLSDERAYSVIGIQTELEEIVPAYSLPRMVQAVLLPFKGQIIYDGLLPGYNISFGGGIRSRLKHEYTVAKEKDRIITTLEPDLISTKIIVPKGSKDLLPRLEHLVAGAGALKGETTLQTAALTLARTSLDLALASVKGENWDAQERSLRRAMTRLSNLLNLEKED